LEQAFNTIQLKIFKSVPSYQPLTAFLETYNCCKSIPGAEQNIYTKQGFCKILVLFRIYVGNQLTCEVKLNFENNGQKILLFTQEYINKG
jgi:hypothetical protein